MSLSHLTLVNLERALELLQKRDSIQAQIDRINYQLHQLENGDAGTSLPVHPETEFTPEVKRRRYRHRTKQVVLKVLERAGANGLTVRELAMQSKIKRASLRTWLYTKAKLLPQIEKIKPGRFAYHAG